MCLQQHLAIGPKMHLGSWTEPICAVRQYNITSQDTSVIIGFVSPIQLAVSDMTSWSKHCQACTVACWEATEGIHLSQICLCKQQPVLNDFGEYLQSKSRVSKILFSRLLLILWNLVQTWAVLCVHWFVIYQQLPSCFAKDRGGRKSPKVQLWSITWYHKV